MGTFVSLIGVYSADAATPFFADGGFTQNGIEWCEENQSLYKILGNKFFEHHKHSIESRVCVSLYNDPLWTYDGPDRYDLLIEKSRYYVALEIKESEEEAKTGVVDPTPAMTRNKTTTTIESKDEINAELNEEVEVGTSSQLEQSKEELDEQSKEKMSDSQTSGGGCLIATAAYGSELSPQVQLLREIRDNKVLSTESGSSFMESFNTFYYSFSPTIADWERESPAFRELVKVTITPMLMSLSLLNYVDVDSEQEVLGYGISIIMLNVGMYFVAPTFAIMKLKRLFNN